MALNWPALQKQTQQYSSLSIETDENKQVNTVNYSGLYAKLSDLVNHFGATPDPTALRGLFVYVDTLVVDTDQLPITGGAIMARQVDTRKLGSRSLVVPRSPAGEAMIEFLVGGYVGNELTISTPDQSAAVTIPRKAGTHKPPTIGYYNLPASGAGSYAAAGDAATFQDLVVRPWVLNALRSSFYLASSMETTLTGAPDSPAAAALEWVRYIATTAQTGEVTAPEDFAELANNAAALLVMLNVSQGAIFVPTLSASYYGQEIDSLLSALRAYEAKESELINAQNIDAAITKVAQGLQAAGSAELAPLNAELQENTDNVKQLVDQIHQLRQAFDLQKITTNTRLTDLKVAMIHEKFQKILAAMFEIATKMFSAGMDAAAALADPEEAIEAIKYAIEALIEAGKTVAELIETASEEGPEGEELITSAGELSHSQAELMGNLALAATSHAKVKGADSEVAQLPIGQVDPQLAWENFFVEVDRKLSNIKLIIGSGAGATEAQEAANNFLAALKVLGNYGKAISAKIAVLSAQVARRGQLLNRIAAAKAIAANWQAIAARAKTDDEKLAGLRGLLQNRENALKQSIFDAWLHYRNAYYYLYFSEPPVTVSMNMDAATLTDRMASVKTWIGRLLGDDPNAEKIELPNENVQVKLEFPVHTAQEVSKGKNVALFTPKDQYGPDRITWNIPFGSEQFNNVLPHSGEVAIWITSAKFFLDGVVPNDKGNVMMSVATSGTYLNGYDPDQLSTFVNKPLEGDYAYKQNDDGSHRVYNQWAIDPDVYASPTPYTQWQINMQGGNAAKASNLRLLLTIAYRRKT